jgi:hypothetical protein
MKTTPRNFFEKLGNTKPFLKMSLLGEAGGGKTYTAATVASGLHDYIKNTKPVVIFDTEESAKFLTPMFSKHGIEVVRKPSRSLADLRTTMNLMVEDGFSDILMIDSVSHLWLDLVDSYLSQKKKNKTFIEMQDWGNLKKIWARDFSDPLVMSKLHIVMTGRAADEYETSLNEETNKMESHKIGIKMQAAKGTAYEPDLSVQMTREMDGDKMRRACLVLKDRSALIDGKVFYNPTFKNFKPVVDAMLEGIVPQTALESTPATALVEIERYDAADKREREVMCEEIAELMKKHFPSQGADDKSKRMDLLERCTKDCTADKAGTRSWTKVESFSLDALRGIYLRMRLELEPPTENQADEMPDWGQ